MKRDERLKKYQEAGAEFVEAAATKVGDFLHEVSSAGETTHDRATSAVDDLVGGGKRSTDQLFDAIRREISAQLKSLGLVTTADLDALERRLTGRVAATKAPAAKKTVAKKTVAKKTVAKKTVAKKSPAKKSAATKSAATRSAATKAAKKAAAPTRAAATKAGGATRKTAKKATGTTKAAAKKAASAASGS